MENLTPSDRLQEAWYNSEEHFERVNSDVVRPCLYGFSIDCAQQEAILVLIFIHKKKFLNSHCIGYEYANQKQKEEQATQKQ